MNQRLNRGFNKMDGLIHEALGILHREFNHCNLTYENDWDVLLNLTGIKSIKRVKSERSEMQYVTSHTGTVINLGNITQKQSPSGEAFTFEKSKSIAMGNIKHSSHETSAGVMVGAGVELIIQR